jgi:ribonuclease-3
MNKFEEFEQSIGYPFKEKKLLHDALTHPTIRNSKFEILEFIGDRVVGLAVATMLWNWNLKDEKEYAQKFVPKTNRNALSAVATTLELEKYIVWRGEKSHEKSILADACEAFLGALFIDAGFEITLKLIKEIWGRTTFETFDVTSPQSILQNWANSKKVELNFNLIKETGPPHQKEYVVELVVLGYKSTLGVGTSIKEAKRVAASLFLKERNAR